MFCLFPSKLVTTFQQRKLARQSTPNLGMSWFCALQTDSMAAWGCNTALTMMLAVLAMIPNFPGDRTSAFKRLLRMHKTQTT